MRCWTGNENVMGMGMISREKKGMGSTLVILAHLLYKAIGVEATFCLPVREANAKFGLDLRHRSPLSRACFEI